MEPPISHPWHPLPLPPAGSSSASLEIRRFVVVSRDAFSPLQNAAKPHLSVLAVPAISHEDKARVTALATRQLKRERERDGEESEEREKRVARLVPDGPPADAT